MSNLRKNSRKFSEREENAAGKGEISRYEQFLLFPQSFQKTCTLQTCKNKDLFGKGLKLEIELILVGEY